MKKISLILIVLALGFWTACNTMQDKKTETTAVAPQENVKPDKPKDGIFIHLSHGPEDPQRVLMALNMAKMMSDDKAVLLYIDIKGVYTVLKDAPDIKFKAFPSSLELLNELKEKGVEVIVCPGCLKAAEKTPEDVMDWVKIATKERFFDFCDGKIISIDY